MRRITQGCIDPVRLLALAVILRTLRDLRNPYRRAEAIEWFRSDCAAIWAEVAGIEYDHLMTKVDYVLTLPLVVLMYRRKKTPVM